MLLDYFLLPSCFISSVLNFSILNMRSLHGIRFGILCIRNIFCRTLFTGTLIYYFWPAMSAHYVFLIQDRRNNNRINFSVIECLKKSK